MRYLRSRLRKMEDSNGMRNMGDTVYEICTNKDTERKVQIIYIMEK